MSDDATTPAGWYPDVTDATGSRQRWWDGTQWTEHYHSPVTAPQTPAPVIPAAVVSRSDVDHQQAAPMTSKPLGAPIAGVAPSGLTSRSGRRWYQRKAIIIPVAVIGGIVLIGGVANALGGGNRTPLAASTQEAQPVVDASETPRATPTFDIPDVRGTTIAEARSEAEAAGFSLQYDAAAGDDWVIDSQTPSAGRASADPGVIVVTATAPEPVLTLGQENAIESSQSYLRFKGFSRAGLVAQLTSEYGEGFDPADAEFAVSYLEQRSLVDWNAEAVEAAQSYLDFMSFSRDGLYDQLTSEYGEQFTPDQANHALAAIGY